METTYSYMLGSKTYSFKNLVDLMAKATPKRSGDDLAGVSAKNSKERVVAQMRLAEVPLKTFLTQMLSLMKMMKLHSITLKKPN